MRCWKLVVLLSLLVCVGESSEAAAVTKDYQQWVIEQLAVLKGGISLGQWKHDHPQDQIITFKHGNAGADVGDTWCARAETRIALSAGNEAVRYAFFYPPVAPATLSLPTESDTSRLIDQGCTLGVIWTVRAEQDASQGDLLAQEVRAAIDAHFGPGKADSKISFFGSANWRKTGRWKTGETTLVSACSQWYKGGKNDVLAFAFLPISGLTVDGRSSSPRIEAENSEYAVMVARIRDAVTTAGITGHERQQLLDVVSVTEAWQKGKAKEDTKRQSKKVITALKDWLDAAQKLDRRRKAAAMLAADQTLTFSQYAYGVADPEKGRPARRELAKLGADFNDSPLGGVSSYTNSWLQKALDLDPDGPIGDLSFRMFMEKGFDTSGTCSGGNEQFRDVIKKGEAYLQKKHNPAAQAAVELMVADAYRDIVALANGAADEYAETASYQSSAVDARQRAIKYYRAALSHEKESAVARAAWAEAWRLIAGLPPTNLRYYCIYD